MSLLDAFDALDGFETREVFIRAPFPYPGGKSRSLKHILPLLPYRNSYIEVFGGSGVMLLNRGRSNVEVFNDRYAGVVAFYRCIRDKEKLDALVERLEYSVMSREEFIWTRDSWASIVDDVERAARWFYTVRMSFGSMGRNFGRSIKGKNFTNRIIESLERLPEIHTRFKHVIIENLDWRQCLNDYDHKDAVFYLDPPYIGSGSDHYEHYMTEAEHDELCRVIMNMRGFVALSGYQNNVYNNYKWDGHHSWDSRVTIQSKVNTEDNYKEGVPYEEIYGNEMLWIKEAY